MLDPVYNGTPRNHDPPATTTANPHAGTRKRAQRERGTKAHETGRQEKKRRPFRDHILSLAYRDTTSRSLPFGTELRLRVALRSDVFIEGVTYLLKEHTALSISFAAFLCTHRLVFLCTHRLVFLCTHRLVFLTNTSSYLHCSSCRPVLIHPKLPASLISSLFHLTPLNLPVINSSELCIQLCRPLAPTWTGLPCARNSLLYRIHCRDWLHTPCFLRR
jgi:hypothetical protein